MQDTMVCAQHRQTPDATDAEEGSPWAIAVPIGNMDRQDQHYELSHHKQQRQVSFALQSLFVPGGSSSDCILIV